MEKPVKSGAPTLISISSKGHSASYAVESYQSLYLKKYFPLEFILAALNNGGGFYDVETYIQEIRKCGGIVHAPCINHSDHPNVIYGKDIYLGLGHIKDLETKVIQKILKTDSSSEVSNLLMPL